jgi:heat shock protein HtpX
LRAFFLNDVTRAHREINDLRAIDRDFSGTIDQDELLVLRSKEVRLRGGEKIAELLTTHPNMLKRIQRLATLA